MENDTTVLGAGIESVGSEHDEQEREESVDRALGGSWKGEED